MPKEHFQSATASIDYGDAAELFPVDDLDAEVLQHRDAQLELADVDGEDVVVVAPTSLATSYFLTQHALTAIPIDSLPPAAQAQLGEEVTASLDTFELIQIGKWTTDSPNHSLAEFGNP
ncbi:hypothetical protein [Halorientalis regularis]|uniref:hypothetical protein n=1 Tax=Halorientalis regularis TaxID=660518 RepID=UPI000B86BED6|nr:hypothetical protein [Halorientalis regularis]